jgi:hypothetical protein
MKRLKKIMQDFWCFHESVNGDINVIISCSYDIWHLLGKAAKAF